MQRDPLAHFIITLVAACLLDQAGESVYWYQGDSTEGDVRAKYHSLEVGAKMVVHNRDIQVITDGWTNQRYACVGQAVDHGLLDVVPSASYYVVWECDGNLNCVKAYDGVAAGEEYAKHPVGAKAIVKDGKLVRQCFDGNWPLQVLMVKGKCYRDI
jgi:hypothetical protein